MAGQPQRQDDVLVLGDHECAVPEGGAGPGGEVTCWTARQLDDALRLLATHPSIGVVVLARVSDLARAVKAIKSYRPDVVITAITDADRIAAVVRAGVRRFLPFDWTLDDVRRCAADRIRNCSTCGMALPLRRVREGEAGGRWICGGCGAHYAGLVDEDAPASILANVRRAVDP